MSTRRLSRQIAQIAFLAAGLVTICGTILGQSGSGNVTLCAVAATPEKFNNQLVTISAHYESDGMEREGLSDPSCREAGTELRILPNTRGAKKLRLALRGGYPGTLDKTVEGTFTGVFHWNPEKHPPRSIDVQFIENVTVERKSPPSTSPNSQHALGDSGVPKPQ
jgi:hypothetical protein